MHAAGIEGVLVHVWRRAHCSENRLRDVVPNVQEFRIDFDLTNEIKLLFYRLLWIRLLKAVTPAEGCDFTLSRQLLVFT